MNISGDVASGFESVQTLFERNMHRFAEQHAQLCVYVGGEKVVDLCATNDPSAGFDADSLVNVFSSGKSLEAIAMAWLVSQGRISFSDKVVDYWPEFGAGKEHLTVADVMRHEAGLAALNVSIAPEDLHRENIKQNKIGAILENHPPAWREGDDSQREYHAVTRGWIVNEIFRRADRDGRTIGEFAQQELRQKLGAEIVIGVPEEDLPRRVDVNLLGARTHFAAAMQPFGQRRKVVHNVFQLGGRIAKLAPSMRKGTALKAPPPFEGMESVHAFNDKDIVMGETPSANAHCSARGLARLAAAMASGGSLAGHELISKSAWDEMHAEAVQRDMLGLDTIFTQGGVALFSPEAGAGGLNHAANKGRDGFYGWMGLGGSIFQWQPERQIGFAFVPTSLHFLDFFNERGKAYQAEVLRCVA